MTLQTIGPDGTAYGVVCECGATMRRESEVTPGLIGGEGVFFCEKCYRRSYCCDSCGRPGAELASQTMGQFYCPQGSNQACAFGKTPEKPNRFRDTAAF